MKQTLTHPGKNRIRRLKENLRFVSILVENTLAAFGIVDKTTEDIPQPVLLKRLRRQGMAAALLVCPSQRTAVETLSAVNEDT